MNTEHKYFFDTNCWSESFNRLYPQENFPSVWNFFEKKYPEKNFKHPEIYFNATVVEELSKQDDDLFAWFEKAIEKKLFTEVPIVDSGTIVNKYYKNARKKNDAFIIDTAQKENLILVTLEERASNQTKIKLEKGVPNPKIPNVCELEKIECIHLKEFWEREKIVF